MEPSALGFGFCRAKSAKSAKHALSMIEGLEYLFLFFAAFAFFAGDIPKFARVSCFVLMIGKHR
jgi:hypothetical protein